MKIEFDDTNLLAEMVGEEHGLSRSEIKEQSAHALDALDGFKKLSESGEQGFAHLPFQAQVAKDILGFARELQGDFDTVCVVGIGGSALGATAVDCALRGPHPVQRPFSKKNPRMIVLDNVDPSFVEAALDVMDPKRTVVVATAKSGSTAETAATFLIVREWMARKLGRKAARRIAAVTTEGRGDLDALAKEEHYREFAIPENVGGRFSVLSPVGMLPAALVGIDIRRIFRGAEAITHECWQRNLKKNTALRAALAHYLMMTNKQKAIQVAFPYSNRLWSIAMWFRQLWAESLGKARNREGEEIHAGQTPVAALGATDQHSQMQLYIEGPNDKVFTFWALGRYPEQGKIPKKRTGLEAFDYLAGQTLEKLIEAERRSAAAALVEANRPNATFTLERLDEEHVGGFLQLLEFETAFAGELLNVNAFDQEGVELGKQFTYGLMGRTGFESYRERFERYEKARGKA
jgi:glucose-6-phosphate isomerase